MALGINAIALPEMEIMMATITLLDFEGTAYEAAFRAIEERDDAIIGLATFNAQGADFRVPAVVYSDGTVICATDWQNSVMSDQDIVEEASDPKWAHHWAGPKGETVNVVDGLPRLFD